MTDSREVLTRPAREPDLVVRYGDGPDHVADVRLPERPAPDGAAAPLVLFLHGGFWRSAYDRAHTGPLAAALADLGHAVATAEYRRTGAPGGGWPGTFDDVARAVDTLPALVAAAARGRVDPARTVLAGHSAGGHLALWAAVRHRLPAGAPWAVPAPAPYRGVLALAPVCDLAACHRLDLDGGAAEALLGGGPRAYPERYDAVDPMRLPLPPVPAVLVHGTRDGRVPPAFSRDYCAPWRAAREPSGFVAPRHVEIADADHFALIDPLAAAWPVVTAALSALLAPTTTAPA